MEKETKEDQGAEREGKGGGGEGAAPAQQEQTPEEQLAIMQMITDSMSKGNR